MGNTYSSLILSEAEKDYLVQIIIDNNVEHLKICFRKGLTINYLKITNCY